MSKLDTQTHWCICAVLVLRIDEGTRGYKLSYTQILSFDPSRTC